MFGLIQAFYLSWAFFRKYLGIFRCPISPIQEPASSDSRLQFISWPWLNRIQLLIIIAFKPYHISYIRVYSEILNLEGVLVPDTPTVCDGRFAVIHIYGQVDRVRTIKIEQALSGWAFKTFLIFSHREIFLWVNVSWNSFGGILVDSRRIGIGKEDNPCSIDASICIEEYARTSSIITP